METPDPVRILLTNDDGIHAEGLVSLERIARALSDEIWICAPEYEQSGASRSLTLAEPLRVRRLDARRFATTGTPTDCVMLAVTELMGGLRPDLVLSGVNRGANLAEDVTMSGTVAGAIEGMALGIPAIALSQMSWPTPGEEPADQPVFLPSEHFGPGIVRRLVEIGWPSDVEIPEGLARPSRGRTPGERPTTGWVSAGNCPPLPPERISEPSTMAAFL